VKCYGNSIFRAPISPVCKLSGSSVGDKWDLSCARTNFSKHFIRMCLSATGRKSFRPAAAECLGTGTIYGCGFKARGDNSLGQGLGLQRGGNFPVNFRKLSSKCPWEVKLGNFGNIRCTI